MNASKSPTKRSVDRQTISLYLAAAKRVKPAFYLIWLTPVSTVAMSIVIPFFVSRILVDLAHPPASVTGPLVGLIIAGIIGVIANRVAFLAMFKLQADAMYDLQTKAFTHLTLRGTSFHNNNISGKLTSDILDYSNAFMKFSETIVINALPFFITLVLGIVLVSLASPLIGVTVFCMSALAIASGVLFRIKMAPFRHQRLDATKAATAHLADTITNNQTVKAFGREQFELRSQAKLSDQLRSLRIRDWSKLAINGSNRIAGLFLFEVAFVSVIIFQIHRHPEMLAAGIFAFSYTVTLANRLFDVGTMMRGLEESLLQAEPMTRMLHENLEVQDDSNAQELIVRDGKVTFDNVRFHYSDNTSNQDVFNKLNLSVGAGEKIGLVGPSGGGKSSLTKLLLRFEDIHEGTISIDGQNIAAVTQASLHQAIGYVSQEPLLFHRTIEENIAYGRPEASDAEIREAARKAYALDFIEALPKGFKTVVGERGVKLSGGQRQRIAIARAILKNAPILVLDEATSALDSESEKVIQDALWELMKDKTAIVIAHRLSTIQKLDRIIVLNNGKITESGSHADLLKQNGLYAKLWNHQSGGFLED